MPLSVVFGVRLERIAAARVCTALALPVPEDSRPRVVRGVVATRPLTVGARDRVCEASEKFPNHRRSTSSESIADLSQRRGILRIVLYEDDVVSAVVRHLRAHGWTIESMALATQHGDDIVATRNGERLIVEAKGEGSSKEHTSRFGKPFNQGQASTHVGLAVLRSLRVVSEGTATAAIALPDVPSHRREVERVARALSNVGVWVFWVAQDGEVRKA
jgi:hypothetical protein